MYVQAVMACVTCPAAAGESEGASPLVSHVRQEEKCKMLYALALQLCRGTSKRQMQAKPHTASVKILCAVVHFKLMIVYVVV